MITAKDKALQLINRFNFIVLDTHLGGSIDRVKKCALLTIDEMIRISPHSDILDNQIENFSKEFYIQVKKEIENLK